MILGVLVGQVSFIWKVRLGASVRSVSLSSAFVNRLISNLEMETGISAAILMPALKSKDLVVEMTLETTAVLEHRMEEASDEAEYFVKKIGDATGLRKPVREVKSEIVKIIDNPESIFEFGEEVVDGTLDVGTEILEDLAEVATEALEDTVEAVEEFSRTLSALLSP